jgi:hypothetical protein
MAKTKKVKVLEKTELEKNVEKESKSMRSRRVHSQGPVQASSSGIHNEGRDSQDFHLLPAIPSEKYFMLPDGRAIKDYAELAKVIETLPDELYFFHANDQKNDFASWIMDVFHEEDLAENIRSAKSRIEVLFLLYKDLFEKSSGAMEHMRTR